MLVTRKVTVMPLMKIKFHLFLQPMDLDMQTGST